MRETIDYVKTFARFPFALRRFHQHRLTLDKAKQIVRQRMEHREENFLRLVEKSIYGFSRSPYLPLLKMAGCELGDLRALVRQKGVEGALRILRESGVYATFEEFKGRKPIVRNGKTIPVTARDFDNPFARRDFVWESGGSTGLANSVNQDLDQVAASAVGHLLTLAAHNALDMPMGQWTAILPGAGLHFALQRAYLAQRVDCWFSPLPWRASKYWFKYSLATLYMILCLRLNHIHLPIPETIKPDQAERIARWMRAMLNTHGRCLFYSNVSHALRVCLAAEHAGFDLRGAIFRVGGEPVTEAKADAIRRIGARLVAMYGSIEANGIGLGCARPAQVDQVHLANDAYALIAHPYAVPNFPVTVSAFNLTTLLDSAPKVLLNYQSDDYGNVQERSCGCPLEAYGYTTHLSGIRSYSKLVGEGVSLIGDELVRIIEQVLPARFGGSPLDYQMIEQEDAQGFTRLGLIISPHIQIEDEGQVIHLVLDALRASVPMADAARAVWQNSDTFCIERREPIATTRGKIFPLHIQRGNHGSDD